MDQKRLVVGLLVALVFGLVAARYVYVQLRNAKTVVSKPLMPTGRIVVAAKRVELGQRLTSSDLREITWPDTTRPTGSFMRISDCLDRALITPVVENEIILEEKLAPKEAGGGLSVAIPEGTRGISVRVDDVVSVAGFVAPGTMVDVLVTGQTPGGDSITRTILQDLRVLAVGQKSEPDREGKPQTYTVVTLLVTPEEAEKVTMGSTEGKIHLALRNTIDTKEVNPPPVSRNSLFAGAPPPAPPAAAPTRARRVSPSPPPQQADVYVIDVIRGDKHESQSFAGQQVHQ
jgi:pilus assembly protein CpaB